MKESIVATLFVVLALCMGAIIFIPVDGREISLPASAVAWVLVGLGIVLMAKKR